MLNTKKMIEDFRKAAEILNNEKFSEDYLTGLAAGQALILESVAEIFERDEEFNMTKEIESSLPLLHLTDAIGHALSKK